MRTVHLPRLLAVFALVPALVGVLAPAPARAAARLLGIPGQVRAGDRVEVRWSGLDVGVEEVELELSVAGSRWVRISPEMEALEGRYVWRVTGGLSGSARVRLRAGGEHGEREVASHAFTIVPKSAAHPAVVLAWPDGWDLDGGSGPADAALAAARSRYLPLVETEVAATSSSAGAGPDDWSSPTRESGRSSAFPLPGATRAFHAPRRNPLRI